jgi:2-dehydro-3-deoxyglucarate aldolase/4-hydroxy-2-oxoheptanedioate aldolase
MTLPFVDLLRRREPLLGTLLSLPSPEIAELLAGVGFDWLFVDLEHGLLDVAGAQRMVQAAAGCPCLVRVPSGAATDIGRALDIGAAGIIVPHVNTAAEAAAAVQAAKYPPAGTRSIGAARAQGYGLRTGHAVRCADATTAVVAQVEHVEGVRRIEEIVGIPGVDAIFIGPFDLSASLGTAGAIEAAAVQDAIATVLAACRDAGKPCGIFLVDATAARQAFEAGHSLVCLATDTLILGNAATSLVAAVRARP